MTPMLADVVRKHRDEVLEIATERLAELIPEQSLRDADNYLPTLVDEILAGLSDPQIDGSGDPRIARSAAEHGRERQRFGSNIEFVVHDFGVICDGISEVARRLGMQIDAGDWQKLNRALDFGIARAISGFEALRREQEQRDSAAELGGVAHELRNALAAASVAFEAVRRGRVGTQSRTADIVMRNLKRGGQLAANLVLESKLLTRPEPAFASLMLRPIVEDVVAATPAADAMIEIDVAPRLTVVADRELLTSALTNLVQNALKFTRSGGTVTVRARPTDQEVVIEVEDQCGGLPPEKVEALFEPFVQEGQNRTGLGLGLSIVRRIMLAHGGGVRARDLPGRGCIFELSFPLRGAP